MANEPRMFREDELELLVADRVAKETAELETKVSELEAEVADLRTKHETAEALKVAAEQAAAEAAAKLEELTGEVEQSRADKAAAVKAERAAKIRELTSDDFVTAEREESYAAMEQAAFDDLVAQLEAAATKRAANPPKPSTETAAFTGGSPAAPKAPADGSTSVLSRFLAASAGL